MKALNRKGGYSMLLSFKLFSAYFLSEKEAIIGDKSALNSVSGDKETTLPFYSKYISNISEFSQVKRKFFLENVTECLRTDSVSVEKT